MNSNGLSKAILTAGAAPAGPVYLSLPLDDWDEDADEAALAHLKARTAHDEPVVSQRALDELRGALGPAANPLMVVGPGIDDDAGWDGSVRLAELLALPVLVAPSPSRCPFPTRDPHYRGVLPSSIPAVSAAFEGHDLVVVFGAAVFRYHEFGEGDFLPRGTELWGVTSDPDEASRAPVGQLLIGSPSDALSRLAEAMSNASRSPVEPLTWDSELDDPGPAFSAPRGA